MTASPKSAVKKSAKALKAAVNSSSVFSNKVELVDKNQYVMRNAAIPPLIWKAAGKTKLAPVSFCTGIDDGLNKIQYNSEAQEDFLINFNEDPTIPGMYVVCSSPNDEHANVVAAHLMARFISKTTPENLAYWLRMSWGKFDTQVFNTDPAFIVVSGISPIMSIKRLEFVQEVIDVYAANIPVIISATGMNPISLAATKLYRKPVAFYYHCSSLVKNEVI